MSYIRYSYGHWEFSSDHEGMDVTTLIQLATLISVVVGVTGLLISVRAYKRQVSPQFLLEYSKRVDAITQSLPVQVWAAHLFPDEEPPEPGDEVRVDVLRCLNYISRLRDFSRQRYIPDSMRRKHHGLYTQILRSPRFRCEWKTLARCSPPSGSSAITWKGCSRCRPCRGRA